MEGFIEPLASTRTRYESPIERSFPCASDQIRCRENCAQVQAKTVPRLMCEALRGCRMWAYT
jgi:hypothetical protein